MLTGFDMELLKQKYAIEQQNANTAAAAQAAQAKLGTAQLAQAGTISDPLSLVQQQLSQAQTQDTLAHAAGTNVQSALAQDENQRKQQEFNQGFNSNYMNETERRALALKFGAPRTTNTLPSYKKGVARVPKTAPAKLHKDEAILNKPAADSMGRGLIAALNAMGQQKMGMV